MAIQIQSQSILAVWAHKWKKSLKRRTYNKTSAARGFIKRLDGLSMGGGCHLVSNCSSPSSAATRHNADRNSSRFWFCPNAFLAIQLNKLLQRTYSLYLWPNSRNPFSYYSANSPPPHREAQILRNWSVWLSAAFSVERDLMLQLDLKGKLKNGDR